MKPRIPLEPGGQPPKSRGLTLAILCLALALVAFGLAFWAVVR